MSTVTNLKNKTITVITAAYSADKFILEAVRSVLDQTLPEGWKLQYIVGVDCCEKTLNKLKFIKSDKLHVYMMNSNRGTYVTFNTMMLHAEGSIICRFDADDIMLDSYLKDTIELIKSGYSLLLYENKQIDLDGNRLKGGGCSHGVMSFTKDLWNLNKGFQPWKCAADTDFFFRAKALKSVKCKKLKNRIYFLRRMSPGQLTAANQTRFGSPYRNERASLINKAESTRVHVKPVALTAKHKKVR